MSSSTDESVSTDSSASVDVDVGEWTLSRVREQTQADPDGVQNAQGNVWTSKTRVLADARKSSTPFDRSAVESALAAHIDAGRVLSWNGLLAPADDDHLLAVIKNEQQAGITRALLVGKANKLRSERQGGGRDE